MSMAQVGDINMELKWIVLLFFFVAASLGSYWLFTIIAALMIITLSISPSHVKVLDAMFRSSASNYQGWWLIRIVLIFLVLAEQTWLTSPYTNGVPQSLPQFCCPLTDQCLAMRARPASPFSTDGSTMGTHSLGHQRAARPTRKNRGPGTPVHRKDASADGKTWH